MPDRLKLTLDDLKVRSFATSLEHQGQEKIAGADPTDAETCVTCNTCWTLCDCTQTDCDCTHPNGPCFTLVECQSGRMLCSELECTQLFC